MRAPFQILVLPYKKKAKEYEFCIFKRKDMGVWQGIAGGGEDGEKPIVAARRESLEEAGISGGKFTRLDSVSSIPVETISGFIWGDDVLVIPEYSFGVELQDGKIIIEREHTEYKWMTFKEAHDKLEWDSNKTALWELNHRLLNNKI